MQIYHFRKKDKMSKFKIGDKVKIRKDLKVHKEYDGFIYGDTMSKYKDKNATISRFGLDFYYLDIDNGFNCWTDEMLEPVKEEQEVVEYKNKKYDVAMIEKNYNSPFVGKDCLRLTLKEHKEEILDEAEKEYLRNVIKPFRNRVKYIKKEEDFVDGKQFIYIVLIREGGYDDIPFPSFKKNAMYRGMEINKEYTLEQLGL
jgi:hypothetical protein